MSTCTLILLLTVFAPCVLLQAAEPEGSRLVMLGDAAFQQGLLAKSREGADVSLTWKAPAPPPVWDVAQHASRSCVADSAFQTFRASGMTFKDNFQWVEVHPEHEDADLILGVNAFAEFNGRFRPQGDPWPHLYVRQRISAPAGHLGASAPSIADLAQVEFNIGVRLLYDRRHIGPGYDVRLHAAQFVCFLTVQNLNRTSAGYGDYYWFGALLYDDRKPVTSLRAARDSSSPKKTGTGKLIYDVGIKPFTDKVVADGEWVDVKGDLLPHLVAGLNEAWKQGYLGASKDLRDYRLGGAVIGWEVTGLNDAAVAVKNLRCVAHLKP